MTLSIMQPYFLPYLGYFSLIKHTDEFILFDTPQFIRHGWIERNQILKQNGEPMYIRVPLNKFSREEKINDISINNTENWKSKILAQLIPYKKKAPNYWQIIKLLKEIFELETNSIVKLNQYSLQKISQYLGISTPIKIWSEMNVDIDPVNAPDEWALNICKALKAKTYYNPIGGTDFFDRSKYEKENIDLKFMDLIPLEYDQGHDEFVPFLSIIDVLMHSNIKSINEMIDSYKLSN